METQQYSSMLDRVMAQEIQSVNWSKTMDVCAILYINHQLEICRVSEQLQRMFLIQEEDIINNITVESTFLAYTVGNKFFVYHLASHQRIIQSILIKTQDKINQLLFSSVNVKMIKERELLASIIPLQTTNLKNWQNLCFLREQQVSNNIVFSLTDKQIAFNFNGILNLGDIDFPNQTSLHQLQNELHCFSNNNVSIFDINQLKHPQILKYIQQLSYLNELLSFLKTSILFVNTQLQDIFKSYQLNIIGPLISFGPQETINLHILQFYQQGTCPQELVQFFQKELYNTKILQKMDENITNSFNNIQEILQDSLMNVLQRILVILNFFIQSKQMPYFQGIHKTPFEELRETIQKIFNVFGRFQIECHQTKLHLRNFFVWLNLCAIKSVNDQEVECENVNSPLNKIEVDLGKLYDFLKDNHLFCLKNLSCFYQEKIQPKTFFAKVYSQKKPEIRQTDNITKIMKNVFQGLYCNLEESQKMIEQEEQFVTVNSLVRQLQNFQDQVSINIHPKLLCQIQLDLQNSIIRFSNQEESTYTISVLSQNLIKQYQYQKFNFTSIKQISFNNKIISDLQFYDENMILLVKVIKENNITYASITSEDEEIQNKFECHSIKDLQVSKKGLISVVVDQKKLIILSI